MNQSTSRYFVAGVVALLLALYTIFIPKYETITTLQAAYATLIIVLGVLPWVVTLMDKRESGLIPLMPLHGFFYAFTFGLPALTNKTVWLASGEDEITYALVLTILGLIFLYLGFYGSRKFLGKLKPIPCKNVPVRQQIMVAWVLFGFFISFKLFPVLRTLPSVEQLSIPLGYLSLGILALLAFNRRLPLRHFLAFVMAVLFTLVYLTLTGLLAFPVFLLVFLGILFWNQKKRIPWGFILLAVFIGVFISPAKYQYRDVAWNMDNVPSLYDKVVLFSSAIQEHWSAPSGDIGSTSEDLTTINRLAHISTFGYVIAVTPKSVPYWLGESYETLLTSFIPRVIWPGKPQSTIGQDFGHRYSFLADTDYRTSWNLGWLIEFYANFGSIGVFAGMFLVGVGFRFLVYKFRVPVSAHIEHALAVTIIFGLFYAESNLALMIGALLPVFISLFVLLRLMTGGRDNKVTNFVQRMPRSSSFQSTRLK